MKLDDIMVRLRQAAAVQTLSGLSDPELLERFVGSNDGSAFAVLVERHGPMVLGVCRRALSSHDAEDAYQAVFLVLARKASSLGRTKSLAGWLHGVARKVTANARRDAELRKAREACASPRAPRDPTDEVVWREVQVALDEALGRLPERYRAPVMLCYLECLTRDEAAARLGISTAALHGRLERGRDLLRKRLSGRGLSLPQVMTAAALGESGAIPPMLAVSTVNAASAFAAGQPIAISANVVALTREILMSMTRVKLYMVGGLCAALALIGGSFLPSGTAQNIRSEAKVWDLTAKAESDEAFIRRISKDLRETEPTPAEVHFFLSSKEPGKRQKLVDLFIQERKAKKEAKLDKIRQAERKSFTVFQLQHGAATEMAKTLSALVEKRGGKVVAEPSSNRILILADEADLGHIRKLVEAMDSLAKTK